MELKQPDSARNSTTAKPSFMVDFANASLSTIFSILLWILFFQYYPVLGSIIPLFFGISVGTLVGTVIIIFFTYSILVRWFEIWAYQIASWRYPIPYMNYRTKCPFLQRRYLTFSCRAEQIAPFDIPAFEKCHKSLMWEACWPERIPSILQVYDEAPPNVKQQYSFILAAMKEIASPAADKMYEALTSETLEIQARVSAGYALEEMKNERGIEPLISMLGQFDQRTNQMIQAILVRYKDMAMPYLISAIQNCEGDMQCGTIVEILGKIKHDDSVATIENLLTNEETGEVTRLQSIYALQEVGSEKAMKALVSYFKSAPAEEHDIIKDVLLNQKLISFPLLIELLSDPETPEDYYTRIGDILADVDAITYDRFFTKLGELKGLDTVHKLATILKENTPEEEEFQRLHEVLSKHQTSIQSENSMD
ncbi:MAG: HEAT repeat domain-containing protein [Promethearchaeota archaeon]